MNGQQETLESRVTLVEEKIKRLIKSNRFINEQLHKINKKIGGGTGMDNTAMLQELKSDYITSEEWLSYYPARLKQYYQDLNYISTETNRPEVFSRSEPANVVIQKVISLAELDKAEQWLIVIELVETMLAPKKKLFLEIRRKAASQKKMVNGHEVWRTYVQRHYADEMVKIYGSTPEKFWLAENTITNWWSQIVGLAELIALKKRCL